MSQRRQDARKAAQDKRRQERREARVQQRRREMGTRTTTSPAAPLAPARRPPALKRPISVGPVSLTLQAWIILLVVVALVAAAIAYLLVENAKPLPGVKYPSNGNLHVTLGEPHGAYFSNPPTSGWHLDPIPRPGTYTTPVEPEGLGHFMEHGGVWVLYTCPDGCPEVVDQLKDIVNKAIGRNNPTALAPFPPPGREAPEHRINIIAWQYLLSMDEVDRGAITDFIDRQACRYNPEGGGICGTLKGSTGPVKTPESGGYFGVSASATAIATVPAPTSTPTAVPAGPAPPPSATGTPAR